VEEEEGGGERERKRVRERERKKRERGRGRGGGERRGGKSESERAARLRGRMKSRDTACATHLSSQCKSSTSRSSSVSRLSPRLRGRRPCSRGDAGTRAGETTMLARPGDPVAELSDPARERAALFFAAEALCFICFVCRCRCRCRCCCCCFTRAAVASFASICCVISATPGSADAARSETLGIKRL
jgi:hypothetical protein